MDTLASVELCGFEQPEIISTKMAKGHSILEQVFAEDHIVVINFLLNYLQFLPLLLLMLLYQIPFVLVEVLEQIVFVVQCFQIFCFHLTSS